MRMDIFQFRGYGADYSVDEIVLYFECLSMEHRAFLKLPQDPRYSFKPKFDIDKLFKPERVEETKKMLAEKQIRASQPNSDLVRSFIDGLELEMGSNDYFKMGAAY